MRIAYILPEFVTEREAGGLATYYDNISRLLADVGHEVVIIVKSDHNEILDYYPKIEVRRTYTDISVVDGDIPTSYIRTWSMALRMELERVIASGKKIDIVQYANFMGYGIERLEIPTVIRISSYRPLLRAADNYVFDIHKDYKSIKAADYIEDIAIMKADGLYGPSIYTAEYIKKQTGRDVTIIESPFYPKKYISEKNLLESKSLHLPAKYIITFGTLKALKGAVVIGNSIYEILKNCPDLVWVFAGAEFAWKNEEGHDVSPSEYIKNQAGEFADRVVFLGKLKQQELFEVVNSAKFCVMPSRVDNLPNTCIEAMALGKIVIGTIGASFEQLIKDGENGFLIERENADALIKTVQKVWGMKEQVIKNMGDKAKRRINMMAPQQILHEIEKFYFETIAAFEEKKAKKSTRYIDTVTKYNILVEKSMKQDANLFLLPY